MCFSQFWPVSAGFGAELARIGEREKEEEVANQRIECESTCRSEPGVGATALEPHPCFPGLNPF